MGSFLAKPKEELYGGWKTVEKRDPELWQKVLDKVKKEPGPWAAWKAKKAIDEYKRLGGRYR